MEVGRAAKGAVQVDDVQPLGAEAFPVAGRLGRVVAEDRLSVRIALAQANTASFSQINRGVDAHDAFCNTSLWSVVSG